MANPTPTVPTAPAPDPAPAPPATAPPFHRQKHMTYWLRCLKTFLPNAYTSLDANRMMAAYFSLAALALLGELDARTTPAERAGYADWIYAAQHPGGGFRAAPPPPSPPREGDAEGSGGGGGGGDDGGDAAGEEERGVGDPGDPATVPNTYFALAALVVLRDDLARVRRGECRAWLGRCQRGDGSVGQYVDAEGKVGGGSDTRFSYMAVGVRWFLGERVEGGEGGSGGDGPGRGLDVRKLVGNIAMLQTYDGGFCEVPFREAHGSVARVRSESGAADCVLGGYVYCAVSALAILGRVEDGVRDMDALIGWLARRQLPIGVGNADDADDDDDGESEDEIGVAYSRTGVGFNGRCNKVVDSCYSWWICATLKVHRIV
jgi:geranylgeranyl transferase type-1 subunit beta